MVVGENKRTANIMDGIENTGDVRMHDHRLRLKQRFDIVRKLGQGTYGKVQLGINKKTGQEVAIKTIKKCKIESEADLIRIRREVQIMSSVRHPNIVHIYEVFENSEKMILVMEYCSGGELYDYLSQKKVLQEEEARRLFRQIATAVYYCHIHKICHRDLKLENVLLDDTGSAKIADFGLSNVFKETSLLSTFCGSPLYASPEIVKGTPYIGPEVDCWSLGVLLYTLVYGAMPFDGSNFKRLVRQISNGDYYEPKSPSTASPLIRDMLTVDPLKRADIAYICDNPWVNLGYETSCLEMAEALAAETPVRLDLLLSLAPAAPSNSNSVVVPPETDLGPEESCTDLTSSTSMAVEPSNSAEKRILELVAEGGEDAIKPSPTRTLVTDNKRKLELAMSASGLQRKKERVASCASMGPQPPLPEEGSTEPSQESESDEVPKPSLKSSATMTISPAPTTGPTPVANSAAALIPSPTRDLVTEKNQVEEFPPPVQQVPGVADEKTSYKTEHKEEVRPNSVALAADKLTSLSLSQPVQPAPTVTEKTPTKPKKLSIPGGNVGSFKEQFERRASLTTPSEIKRNISKPVLSKIAKPKAQSEEREVPLKPAEGGVRLQQIGIEPPSVPAPVEERSRMGVKKTESEPGHGTPPVDPSVLLQDARRSLQNSMAKLVEEKAGEEHRRKAARDIISSAIRTGKPPMAYGRSSSAGVASLASLASPPGTPPATAPPGPSAPRLYRTEAQHRVEDHRNRGVSVERIIPIHVAPEDGPTSLPSAKPATPATPATPVTPVTPGTPASSQAPLRRLMSNESTGSGGDGEPIKKSAREFIIPIAVEGKGYVTPRQRSLEPEHAPAPPRPRAHQRTRLRTGPMYGSLVSGGESDEEDDTHMHRLRSSRAARAESVSSGEEDEEDEGFHLLTADNLFSTLLHRVRALTQRLNGEEGAGFPHHAHTHSLFNNLQQPFFNSPHLPRRHHMREGWSSRDLHADLDSMFSKPRTQMPRGSIKKSSKHQMKTQPKAETNTDSKLDLSDLDLSSIQLSDKEMRALSGLTPALSRRLQQQLLAQLPPAAARSLRRTLSLHSTAPSAQTPRDPIYTRSHSANKTFQQSSNDSQQNESHESIDNTDSDFRKLGENKDVAEEPNRIESAEPLPCVSKLVSDKTENLVKENIEISAPEYCTLPRFKRHSTLSRESTPLSTSDVNSELAYKPSIMSAEANNSRGSSVYSTPDRPLLSKYLTPERNFSLDESYSSDSGSILSEPSYIAAYGSSVSGVPGVGLRRHSMRLANDRDAPRKRFSRFLRPDFFETPADENLYAKHKKERELETQKILREIREKKNKTLDPSTNNNDVENVDVMSKEDINCQRKNVSPVIVTTSKERSRSITPFFPILDNIKEATLDTCSLKKHDLYKFEKTDVKDKSLFDTILTNKESKISRPKSYPVKSLDVFEGNKINKNLFSDNISTKESDKTVLNSQRESKLLRPKSYPTSSSLPEKRDENCKINDSKFAQTKLDKVNVQEDVCSQNENDVEVSFSISLPRKKSLGSNKTNINSRVETMQKILDPEDCTGDNRDTNGTLTLKKYQIINNVDKNIESDTKLINNNSDTVNTSKVSENTLSEIRRENVECGKINNLKKDPSLNEIKVKPAELELNGKKDSTKKKIIKKVSSKTKNEIGNNLDSKDSENKKIIKKKTKEISCDDTLKTNVPLKKKSVLQSIGHRLEKLASSKSNSPEKTLDTRTDENKKSVDEFVRSQREHSVPVNTKSSNQSGDIKRAATVTNVSVLNTVPNKTKVSKVLGLFKKSDPKEKQKGNTDKVQNEADAKASIQTDISNDDDKDKPKRPTSLLLNGLSRKNKYIRTSSVGVPATARNSEDLIGSRKSDPKNLRNSLKLDFSRLPRVKKIAPTNPGIEPQIMNISPLDQQSEKKEELLSDPIGFINTQELLSRSRSRSRSNFSNSDVKADTGHANTDIAKCTNIEDSERIPLRNRGSTSPEKEDIVDRIRRKSFYSRFNEKKQRRKSTLVGPGATEYDPIARLHSHPTETKYDCSPTSSGTRDLSPGFSVSSDLSPSTERYRSVLGDIPINNKNNLRFDNNNLRVVDMYRSLDRNDFRKYPSARNYIDDQTSLPGTHRYSRTKSLLDSADDLDTQTVVGTQRDTHKYNRTISLYSPGNYATYRPKRIRNSAIILKESEKEPSPENILDKIRQRKKISISVTRKPDHEKEPLPRSHVSSKGEGNGSKCPEKTD